MRDVHITDNSGGGLLEIVAVAGLVVLGASVLGSVAAALAGALAALITALLWAAFGLAVLAVAIVVACLVWRFRHRLFGLPRPPARPGLAWVTHAGELPVRQARISKAPARPELEGRAPRLHPDDLAELARQIRGGH